MKDIWDGVVPLSLNLEDYEYLPDRLALNKLQKMKELQLITRDYIREFAEPYINGQLNGTGVKISRRQLPKFNQLIERVAAILHILPPQVFIRNDPFLNALTFGTGEQNVIVISHSLYEQLNDCQMSFILGHEMGHIKSQHVLDANMYRFLQNRQRRFSTTLQEAILDWEIKSEVTADRAGLIACQDINQACRSLLVLAAGSIALANEIDIEEYLESQLLSLDFNPVGQKAETLYSHHYIPVRMQQLLDFYYSEEYRQLWPEQRDWPDIISLELEIELK